MNEETDIFEIPDTTKRKGYGKAGDRYRVHYWRNGQEHRRTLDADTAKQAKAEAAEFYAQLTKMGATVRKRAKHISPENKPDLYIYRREPFFVRIGNKQIGTAETREGAEELRDKYLSKQTTPFSPPSIASSREI